MLSTSDLFDEAEQNFSVLYRYCICIVIFASVRISSGLSEQAKQRYLCADGSNTLDYNYHFPLIIIFIQSFIIFFSKKSLSNIHREHDWCLA